MRKIALAGLCYYSNYGDQFIAKTVQYLVRKIDADAEIKFISFEREKSGVNYIVCTLLQKMSKFIIGNPGYVVKYFALKLRMKKYFMKELEGSEGLIFIGGSFKYGNQNVWAMYSICIECCQRMNIPVMFDAMNIQKYSETDWRCQCLKKHANYTCVKMITSRDGQPGVQRLEECYIDNRKIELYPAGDPAFWISECYKTKKKSESQTIGINVIRGDTFLNYGGVLNTEQVTTAYADLIMRLENSGIKWELFTNGLEPDRKMIPLIESKLDGRKAVVRVPRSDEDLVNIISGYKAIVGARLHACICAYSLDIPVSGFIWDEKMYYFSQMARIESFFCSENEFSGEVLFRNLNAAINSCHNLDNQKQWKNKTLDTLTNFISRWIS